MYKRERDGGRKGVRGVREGVEGGRDGVMEREWVSERERERQR